MSKQDQKSENLCNNREELRQKFAHPGNGTQHPSSQYGIHRPLSYHPILGHLCNKGFTGLTCYEKNSSPCENLGSLQNPHQQLPESGTAAVGAWAMSFVAALCLAN